MPSVAAGDGQIGRWTDEEHALFLQAMRLHGREWRHIAALIPTRTVVQIRTHAQKYFTKLDRASSRLPNSNGVEGQYEPSAVGSSTGGPGADPSVPAPAFSSVVAAAASWPQLVSSGSGSGNSFGAVAEGDGGGSGDYLDDEDLKSKSNVSSEVFGASANSGAGAGVGAGTVPAPSADQVGFLRHIKVRRLSRSQSFAESSGLASIHHGDDCVVGDLSPSLSGLGVERLRLQSALAQSVDNGGSSGGGASPRTPPALALSRKRSGSNLAVPRSPAPSSASLAPVPSMAVPSSPHAAAGTSHLNFRILPPLPPLLPKRMPGPLAASGAPPSPLLRAVATAGLEGAPLSAPLLLAPSLPASASTLSLASMPPEQLLAAQQQLAELQRRQQMALIEAQQDQLRQFQVQQQQHLVHLQAQLQASAQAQAQVPQLQPLQLTAIRDGFSSRPISPSSDSPGRLLTRDGTAALSSTDSIVDLGTLDERGPDLGAEGVNAPAAAVDFGLNLWSTPFDGHVAPATASMPSGAGVAVAQLLLPARQLVAAGAWADHSACASTVESMSVDGEASDTRSADLSSQAFVGAWSAGARAPASPPYDAAAPPRHLPFAAQLAGTFSFVPLQFQPQLEGQLPGTSTASVGAFLLGAPLSRLKDALPPAAARFLRAIARRRRGHAAVWAPEMCFSLPAL